MHLSNLPLVQLSLSSFHAITDYSIKSLLKKMDTLKQVTLVDMPQITDRVITKAINICVTDESRTIKLTLSDEQMSKRVRRRHIRYPPNLWVNFDSHLCGKQLADTEPTDVQMILVIIMSAIILGMTLLTTVVVVLVPLSMLLMMAHEWLFELLFTRLESVSLFEGLLRLFTSSTAAPTMISSASAAASDTGPATFLGGVALSFLRKLLSSVATK